MQIIRSKLHYIGHRKRIKEKYNKIGFNGWQDYEILELALTYSIPRKDTKIIAKDLIQNFKTINGVLEASKEELEKVKGVSEHTSLFIKFLRDISICYLEKNLYKKDIISSPNAVYDYLKTYLKGIKSEEILTLFLDNANHLIKIESLQKGTIDKAHVYPRVIVEKALYNHAKGVIIAHNHPGGTVLPSKEDIRLTKIIKNALKSVDVLLLDHIIISGNDYYSFKENLIKD